MIEYRHIQHSFGNRRILTDVSLGLPSNGVVLLAGENGSGKSTLLRIMSGLLKPDEGYISWQANNKPISRAGGYLLEQVMYLHQVPYLFTGSVKQNLRYALRKDGTDDEKRINRALDWVGLTHLSNEYAKTLSGGERQRVALARALLRRPRVLLLDEPTAHLDAAANAQVSELLVELQTYTESMLITSHEPGFMERLGGVEYTLVKGSLIRTPAETERSGLNSSIEMAGRDYV